MKIATWNVNSGSITNGLAELSVEYDVDIAGMQETAEPSASSPGCFWKGDYKHKGVSVSSKLSGHAVDIEGESSPFVALTVDDSPLGAFNVLNVWAKPTPSYFTDLMRTFDVCDRFIKSRPTVILGDFNMSLRLQSNGRQFYKLNARLNGDYNIHSAYHDFTNERFGMESMTTLYYQWGTSGCFHIDYIYLPATWLPRLESVAIPGFSKFATSDHRPIICELC